MLPLHKNPFPNLNRKLPPEILLTVFTFITPTRKSHTTTPFLLSTVCKQWRSIILSTPSLWTHIYIEVPHPNRKEAEETYAMTKKWLSMSGSPKSNLPIDIHFDTGEKFQSACSMVNDYQEALSNIIQPFIPYATRWRSLRVPLCGETSIVFATIGMEYNVPDPEEVFTSLTSLTIDGIHEEDWPDLTVLTNLRWLTLIKLTRDWDVPSLSTLQVNYHNLTRYVCCVPVQVTCIETFIAQCTYAADIALDNVFISGISEPEQPWDQPRRYVPFDHVEHTEIHLPRLQNFVISLQDTHEYTKNKTTNTLAPLFSKLRAPSLRSLISEQQFKSLVSCSDLQLFLKNSQCFLTKLTLNGLTFTESPFSSLIELLTSLTTLEDLSLHLSPTQPETKILWQSLTSTQNNLLPRLKSLQYTGSISTIQMGTEQYCAPRESDYRAINYRGG